MLYHIEIDLLIMKFYIISLHCLSEHFLLFLIYMMRKLHCFLYYYVNLCNLHKIFLKRIIIIMNSKSENPFSNTLLSKDLKSYFMYKYGRK